MHAGRIEFQHVWKKFRRGELHDSLRDLIPALATRLLRGRPPAETLAGNEFWALSDVSFSVGPGQALGIIGPNGAGKSTILKLLTRILRPTAGRSRVEGRVGSLIEIAAGFHPDLTGRENVFLQGAIRGMRRRETASKFDAIVAMAELEEFIDTPVKRYSSGMNARLGFSIAVHLDPDVLVVDEVLSVGDFRFQRKAFERIRQMIASRIPVVIVSHQLERVAELCSEAILLDRGRVVCHASPQECVSAYLAGAAGRTPGRDLESPLTIESVAVEPREPVRSGGDLHVTIVGTARAAPEHHTIGLRVRALGNGTVIFGTNARSEQVQLPREGPFRLELDLQANMGRGLYALETSVWDPIERREVADGPHAVIQIATEQGFLGTVNLHARMRATAPPDRAGRARSDARETVAGVDAGEAHVHR